MIGYYIHHQGHGHRSRAGSIAAAVDDRVVGLSSLPPPTGASPYADWLQLDRDDSADTATDPTAGGALHWAPRHDPGQRQRLAALASWVQRSRPAAIVVDVSVEIAVFVRLLGVPVIVVAMPGDRGDPAHQLAYRMADAILAFWPRAIYDPPWLAGHLARTHFVGALSRFDKRARVAAQSRTRPTAVLLNGTGGNAFEAHRLLPSGWHWQTLGGASWLDDPWPTLCAADVVVTHAGQNALAEVAAAGRPAVVLPQPRPHQEQQRTAAALAAAGVAHVVTEWPETHNWPATLDRARQIGGSGWARWRPGNAAESAATVIDAVAVRP